MRATGVEMEKHQTINNLLFFVNWAMAFFLP